MDIGELTTQKRNIVFAIESFIGSTAEDLANKYGVSKALVYGAIRSNEPYRSDLLRLYYQNGENPLQAADLFVPPDSPDTKRADSVAFQQRLEHVEKRVEALFQIAMRTEQNRPLPPLTLGATVTPQLPPNFPRPLSTADPEDRPQRDYAAGDIRVQGYRLYVCKQAVKEWRDSFTDSINGDVDDGAIIRRITGLFYAGTLEGKGMVYTVKGVNRYALDGVVLHCTIQDERIYVSKVERRSLTDL